jgi:c-di-GMP-binding flagellar brake protein YcgR
LTPGGTGGATVGHKWEPNMESAEKRLYPRLSLTAEDGYFGHFILPSQERLVASIVNISAGGINFSVTEKSRDTVKEGDLLLLSNIAGNTRFSFISEIQGQVRWVKQLQTNFISIGCRFLSLTEGQKQQLVRFVNAERMTRGQYN